MKIVTVKIHGFFLTRMIRENLREPIVSGMTVGELFTRLDGRKVMGRDFFSTVLTLPRRPKILINGLPIELQRGLSTPLRGGEDISVLTTLAEI